jgi:DNA-binding response OmpR family regulator
MGTRILLVEDDEGIGSSLAGVLEGQGHEVRWRRSGRDGLAAADEEAPEVVLLDLGLPDLDGVEVCRRLRGAHPAVAIIVVTARDAEIDVVVGLDAGADDYVTKPFRLAELLARLRAQERRLGRRHEQGPLRAGGIELDVEARRARAQAGELTLSPKEFDLLALLVAECGRAVTRERIIELVWDENWYGSTKTLDMHIVALRRKLAAAGETEARITTLRGVGYRLDAG